MPEPRSPKMRNVLKSIARGANAAVQTTIGPHEYTAADKPINCPHCAGTRFIKNRAQLNSRLLTLMGLDFLDESAVVLVCAECGRIEWFAGPVAKR